MKSFEKKRGIDSFIPLSFIIHRNVFGLVTMKKTIILFVGLVVLGVGSYIALSGRGHAPTQAGNQNASSTIEKSPSRGTPAETYQSTSSPAVQVHLKSVDLSKIKGGPMLSFNFDDGLLSAYEKGLPIFNKAGFKTTQYIITQAFSKVNYVNKQQVLEMSAEGHEIGAHTRTHPHLTTLSEAAAQDEIIGSKQDLIDMGITPTTFAYPYGDENPTVENLVKQAGFAGARITVPEYNDSSVDLFLLKRQRVQADTTFAEIKKAIDDAIAKKKWIILVMHGIEDGGPEDISSHMVQQIVDYVKQANIPVVTTAEGLQVIHTIK